ncbi:uncharacterized protein [Nicotiana sylvestris]|uniref:uncharacterized protein n=1 Tax=Nicotiana sylvestris TaxID=4096 RepID=UPI00388C8D5A
MPTRNLAKWQILISEFYIIYVTQKAVKGQALVDHLTKNSVGGEYEPMEMYFPDEEVSFVGEDITETYDGWGMFFDGAANFKVVGIGAVLVSETGQHYPVSAKLRFPCTNNMVEYEASILGLNMAVDMNLQELLVSGDSDLLVHQVREEWPTKNSKILPYLHHVQELRKRFTKIEFQYVPRIQNEFSDALASLSSMIQYLDKNYIDPISVRIHNQPAYCAHVEEGSNGKPWFHDIKEYLSKREYPEYANHTQKRTLRRLSNHFFHSGGNLYRRTLDLGLLRCVDANEASKLLEDVHAGTYGPHMNGFVLAKKILRGEAVSYKAVTKKVIAHFVKDRIVCRFGVLESIITDNAANLNSDMMKALCETFKIKHKNSTTYIPQMNGVVEAANKNTKKILRKMVENHKQWHEKLPFAFLGYHTMVRTSTEAIPYMLVYGTEAVIPAKVEIPSLRVIQEAELSDAEWIRSHYEQLDLIDGKRMNAMYHGQLYQNSMSRAFNKRVKPRQFTPGQLVLKKIFPHQDEGKGKFSPNWIGPYVVLRVLTGGALILAEMDGEIWENQSMQTQSRDTMLRRLTFPYLM